jgi:hypothetical protein
VLFVEFFNPLADATRLLLEESRRGSLEKKELLTSCQAQERKSFWESLEQARLRKMLSTKFRFVGLERRRKQEQQLSCLHLLGPLTFLVKLWR